MKRFPLNLRNEFSIGKRISENIEFSTNFVDVFRKLTEFIRDHFINRVIKDIRQSAQLSSSNARSTDRNRLAEIIPVVLQKQLELPVPILQSTYLIFKSCEELCALVKCLPSYADEFCQAMIDLLFQHRESCNKLFLFIVEKSETLPDSLYSYEWVKDPDINRHLRTLPVFDGFIRSSKEKRIQEDQSIETLRYRETKETETLLINFSTDEIIPEKISNNYKHLQFLATIHESLDWLFGKLDHYFDILDQSLNDVKHLEGLTPTTSNEDRDDPSHHSSIVLVVSTNPTRSNSTSADQLKLSRLNLEVFSNALKTTLTLAYDILLLLFLEIRLHCFYHFSLLFRHTTPYAYTIDPDPDENLLGLNRDLIRLQEYLQSALHPSKYDLLVQGLPFALANALIRSLPRFQRISESGVMKMLRNIFSLEQTLAQIGIVGDTELMRAHQFYEFLHTIKPEEILRVIEEHRNEYSEQDYLNLIQLFHRNLPSSETFDLKGYEQAIKQVFHPK